jgi:arsenate reductase
MSLNIQLIGTKKCRVTQKAERFFKERRIPFQFRDLAEKGISKGELDNITRVIPLEELIDKEGNQFNKRNMKFMVYNVEDALLNDPLLFRTPIVRNGKLVTLGYKPEVWVQWSNKVTF